MRELRKYPSICEAGAGGWWVCSQFLLHSETRCQTNKEIRFFYLRLKGRDAEVLGSKKFLFGSWFKTSAQFRFLLQKTWCPVAGSAGYRVVTKQGEMSLWWLAFKISVSFTLKILGCLMTSLKSSNQQAVPQRDGVLFSPVYTDRMSTCVDVWRQLKPLPSSPQSPSLLRLCWSGASAEFSAGVRRAGLCFYLSGWPVHP